MKVKQYRQRDSELRGEIATMTKARAAIGDKLITEKRKMTDTERADFTKLGTDITAKEEELADNTLLLEAAEQALKAEKEFNASTTANTTADAAAAAAGTATAGLTSPLVVLKDTKQPVGFFGRQLQAVRRAALVNKGGDEVLTAADRELLKPMATGPTGMNSDVPSEGGFLVAQERSTTIMQRAYETGNVLSRVNRMPIGANSNGILLPAIDETSRADNSRYGGIVSGWLGQALTLSGGKPKFRLMDLKLKKVGAFIYSTDELIADAVALEAWIAKYLPMELTFRTEDAFINGVGSNQPLGILNSGAVLTVMRSTSGHVIADDLRAMYYRLWAGCRKNAAFFVNQSVEIDLATLNIPIGTAGVLDPNYKPATPGGFATYMGLPIIPVEYCANLGTTGDIILADMSEYTAIDKGGVEQAVSLHVAFLTDEAVWRFMYRVDGQCNWNAPLTPKASSAPTLSCAVVLS